MNYAVITEREFFDCASSASAIDMTAPRTHRNHQPARPLWVISGHMQCKTALSALPPKADIRQRKADVRLWATSGH